jgi:hypothetical protein
VKPADILKFRVPKKAKLIEAPEFSCFALKKSTVLVKEDVSPHGNIFGVNVYPAFHVKTRQTILITQQDICQ